MYEEWADPLGSRRRSNFLKRNTVVQARLEQRKSNLLEHLRRAKLDGFDEDQAWKDITTAAEIHAGRDAQKVTTDAGRKRFHELKQVSLQLVDLIGERGSEDWREIRWAWWTNIHAMTHLCKTLGGDETQR